MAGIWTMVQMPVFFTSITIYVHRNRLFYG